MEGFSLIKEKQIICCMHQEDCLLILNGFFLKLKHFKISSNSFINFVSLKLSTGVTFIVSWRTI